MQHDGQRLVVSASDLVGYLACPHLTDLEHAAATGTLARPSREDPELALLQRRGLDHEAAYRSALEADGYDVADIEAAGAQDSDGSQDLAARAAATRAAIAAGTDVIFQATFVENDGVVGWLGHADFLRRVDDVGVSPLYEPEDTKLARSVRPSAALQLAVYAEMLATVQGAAPELVHVVLGGRERESVRLRDIAAAYRQAKRRFVSALGGGSGATYPEPVAHCGVCRWRECCAQRWETDDHLSLVARMTQEQARRLRERAGITTLTELATAPAPLRVQGIGDGTANRLRRQARLQLDSRERPEDPPAYECLEPPDAPAHGFAALPAPAPGDLFFDIEGDPFVEGAGARGATGLEYLFGVGWVDADGEFTYRAFWAHDHDEEQQLFTEFVDFVEQRRAAHPDLHVYHYAPYERATVGKLAGRHAVGEAVVDEWLRADVLVDLYRVVRQGLLVGTDSYSLKNLEPLFMPTDEARTGAIADGASSIVEYERWLVSGDEPILSDLEHYNREDCRATWLLRDWLEDRRHETERTFGIALSRPAPRDGAPSEALAGREAEAAELSAALTDRADEVGADLEPRRLLGHLLGYHRREQRPEWWAYFTRLADADDHDALAADPECLAGLTYQGEVDCPKRSIVHRYAFDPAQEHKFRVGDTPLDPVSARARYVDPDDKRPAPGLVVAVDSAAGTIDLGRKATSAAPHPHALMPEEPYWTARQQDALTRIARAVLDPSDPRGDRYRAVRDLLARRPARITGQPSGAALCHPGEEPSDAVVRLCPTLDRSVLAVQGPPGSGKTYTGAKAIRALAADGWSVGITAQSHKVITNLLDCVADQAADAGEDIGLLQKGDGVQDSDRDDIATATSNDEVAATLAAGDAQVVGGTAWLFADEPMDNTLDYLFIDEGGQLSLADVCAVGTAASNLVVIGDPQQLAQPSKGSHPPGTGVSALEHAIGDAHTIPADRGVFLDRTRRLHPDICAYVSEISYDDRLLSVDGLEQQRVTADAPFDGAGIRWQPVAHHGNRTSSEAEADAVTDAYRTLLAGSWTDRHGDGHRLTADDILVVAPYNAHVNLLAHRLGTDARVGTVDKFQGQQAPVVLVSLATSTPELAPRGMEFLYSRNRLNVAVSRAQALAVVFASPTLLDANCSSVRQLVLLNGLCRLAEYGTMPYTS